MFLPQLLFSGLLIDVELIPSWLQWMEYLCYLKYCINIAFLNETYQYKDSQLIRELAYQNSIDEDKWSAYISVVCLAALAARIIAAFGINYARRGKISIWGFR